MRVLISGAGIAGPALATFLSRQGHNVTIVERSPVLRTTGQQVDVSGEGLKVLKALGIDAKVRAHKTEEEGFSYVNANDRVIASFGQAETGDKGFTREIEILRGELARILCDASMAEGTGYVLGDSISAIAQQSSHATVSFANGADRDFDLVVAADGLSSRTRQIAFPKDNARVRSLDLTCAYFTAPWAPSDGRRCRWTNFSGRRTILVRPYVKTLETSSVYLSFMTNSGTTYDSVVPAELQPLSSQPMGVQKAQLRRIYGNAGWESERLLKAMDECDDFYMQETAQVYADSWVSGRVVLLGDAGYCPSPISGQGTTLALVGAYVLAGCLAEERDVGRALERYETELRPFVTRDQKLPPGAPGIANPQTAFGVGFLQWSVWLAGLAFESGVLEVLGKVAGLLSGLWRSEELTLPEYEGFGLK